jgi:ferric-dicitrate binding protein FerR (iron transport regulator)
MPIQKNSRRINELAKKWKEGTITPEEKEEFDRWYEGAGDDADADMTAAADADAAADAQSVDQVRERIFRTIAEREGLRQHRIVSQLTAPRRRRWLSAAAIVLLLAGFGMLYIQLHTRRSTDIVAHPFAGHELPPGSAKATLTLSDGTVVPLQQGKVGTIRDRNGISIRQQKGALVYEGGSPSGDSGSAADRGNPGDHGEDAGVVSYNTITVPRGGQYQLVLSDGTAVWLNSASSLRYPTVFRGNKRTVTLTGEGYFEVAKDKDHVFQVEAGGQMIDVLGTEFNINCYSDEADVRTTLLQGSVRVRLAGGSDSLVIRPGQQAASGPATTGSAAGSGRLRVIDNADIEQVIAWKNGYFQLNDADIRTIMRQVARWYDVEVKYEGAPPTQELSGKMRRSASAAEFLDMLSYFNIRFRIEGRTIIVMAGGGATKANN